MNEPYILKDNQIIFLPTNSTVVSFPSLMFEFGVGSVEQIRNGHNTERLKWVDALNNAFELGEHYSKK